MVPTANTAVFRYLWLICLLFTFMFERSAKGIDEVLIYYANETYLDKAMRQNYEVIEKWLRSDPKNKKAIEIAAQIEKDRENFPLRVAEELRLLKGVLSPMLYLTWLFLLISSCMRVALTSTVWVPTEFLTFLGTTGFDPIIMC